MWLCLCVSCSHHLVDAVSCFDLFVRPRVIVDRCWYVVGRSSPVRVSRAGDRGRTRSGGLSVLLIGFLLYLYGSYVAIVRSSSPDGARGEREASLSPLAPSGEELLTIATYEPYKYSRNPMRSTDSPPLLVRPRSPARETLTGLLRPTTYQHLSTMTRGRTNRSKHETASTRW